METDSAAAADNLTVTFLSSVRTSVVAPISRYWNHLANHRRHGDEEDKIHDQTVNEQKSWFWI